MRGCLGFIVFVAILVTVLAVAAVELVLPVLVTSAVQGSPLVHGQPVEVQVETSVPGVLLHGQIDAIRITGHDLVETNATIAAIDVTLADVGIADRTFASASGSLSGVVVDPSGSAPISLRTVALSGAFPVLEATITLDSAESAALVQARLRAAGAPDSIGVSLADGHLDLLVAGRTVPARLDTTPQAATLVIDALGLHVPLLAAPADGAWQIGDVQISRTGIRLVLDVDVG